MLPEQQGFAPGFLGCEPQRSCRLELLGTEDRAEGAVQLVEGLLLTQEALDPVSITIQISQ